MMSYGSNPYAPTATVVSPSQASGTRLAGLDKRFFGALIDGLVGLVCVAPGYAMVIASGALDPNSNDPGALGIAGFVWVFAGVLAILVGQIYLLATRSQTIGKYFMKTQIVDVNTGRPAGFVKSFLLRLFVNGLISNIPCIGAIYAIVDICFIFREDRRCIHDLIAGTCVVDIS